MFKILSGKNYERLISELNEYQQKYNELRERIEKLSTQQKERDEQIEELKGYKEEYNKLKNDYEELSEKYTELKEQTDLEFSIEIKEEIRKLGIDKNRLEALWADRTDLIELYIDKLYSLSKIFARKSKEMKENRGLFLILVDARNMVDTNFSEFHEGQREHLMDDIYKGIDNRPHLFSEKIKNVFNYMGEKIPIEDENGEVTGYEEHDGAVLIDLTGIAFRSCLMVEGVRTHKVYNKVEKLLKGNAKHNAAIYASSLDEVMVSIVISEGTSEVTMFRNGKYIKSYNPYTDKETLRKEKVIPMKSPKDSDEEQETEKEADEEEVKN